MTVIIYHGSAPEGSVAQTGEVTPTGSNWSFTAAHLSDGEYTARATQRDQAGNVGLSVAVTFTVITAGPLVTIGPVTSPNKSATPTFTGTGGTLSRDDPTVTVTVYRGTGVGGTVAASGAVALSGSSWSYTPSAPLSPDGTYTVQAVQEDSLGNLGKSAAISFIVDTKAPIVKINTVPAQTKEATPTVEGLAGTAPEDRANVSVAIYSGSTTKGTVVQSASVPVISASWSYTATTLADGTYTVQATQEDQAGNVGKSAAMTFTVDTKAPLVGINPVTPSPGKDATPTLTGAAGVLATDDTTVAVTIYSGSSVAGTVAQSKQVSVTSGSWSYTASELPDGTYTAQATQEDEAGNLGKSAAVIFVIDTKAPVVSIEAVAPRTKPGGPDVGRRRGCAAGR